MDASGLQHGTSECLNCRTRLVGAYCHGCGQSTHIHRTLAAWWHDFRHGVLHVEGALGKTLLLLLFAPGRLTRRYIDGERRRFLAPLPLYLFSVFVLYIVFSIFGGVGHIEMGRGATSKAEQAVSRHLAELDAAIASAQQGSGTASLPGADGGTSTVKLDDLLKRRDALLHARSVLQAPEGSPAALAAEQLRKHATGLHRLDEGLQRAVEDPDFAVFKLQANGYKFSWLLIPLSLPWMWLLFCRRRDVFMFDHAAFVTYSLGFVSLLLSASLLLGAAHIGIGNTVAFLFAAHLFFQLRGTYRLNVWGTLWREVLVLAIAAVSLSVWTVLLVALGLLE